MNYSADQEKRFYSLGPRGDLPLVERAKYLRCIIDNDACLEGKSALEIGAGLGQYTQLLQSECGVSFAIATDLMADQLRMGRKRYGDLTGVAADCFHLPFAIGSFDIVFGSLILHRFRGRELAAVIGEIGRVLKPGGCYFGIEPSLLNPAHVWRHFFAEHSGNEYLMSANALKRAFGNAGLTAGTKGMAPRHPWIRDFGLATCMGIMAGKSR